MKRAHARVLLEALAGWHAVRGDGYNMALVSRVLERLPDLSTEDRASAWRDLARIRAFTKARGELTVGGLRLARRVGAAVHSGAPLPPLERVRGS